MYNKFSFIEFQQRFSTDEKRWYYLVQKRWPDGFDCPVCHHNQYYFIKYRKLFQYQSCRTQVSVTANTILHKTRTSLRKWFWAIYMIAQQKKGISALQLKKFLSLNSYKTSWTMLHKICHSPTFNGVSAKYLQRYLNEFTYRFNRRFWEPQLFDRLLFACTICKKISFAELRV